MLPFITITLILKEKYYFLNNEKIQKKNVKKIQHLKLIKIEL